jgi:NhaA family Na+:H+ antiporter
MEDSVIGVGSPLQRLLHRFQIPVAVLVIPLFALANAGIALDLDSVAVAIGNPIFWGILVGLLVGKPVGITLLSWVTVRLGLCKLPQRMTFKQVFGVGLLAGIGFTMSLFMSELAFGELPVALSAARTGILFASLAAGLIGLAWLHLATRRLTPEA